MLTMRNRNDHLFRIDEETGDIYCHHGHKVDHIDEPTSEDFEWWFESEWDIIAEDTECRNHARW